MKIFVCYYDYDSDEGCSSPEAVFLTEKEARAWGKDNPVAEYSEFELLDDALARAEVITDRCEWNPLLNEFSEEPARDSDCPNQASLLVGANGFARLCSSCAELPAFNRYKKREPIL